MFFMASTDLHHFRRFIFESSFLKTYELDETVGVIADDNGPQGIGGVMGGEDTGVGDATTEVFLEVALFDPLESFADFADQLPFPIANPQLEIPV